ncbi:MAG TPA: Na+/H+ antiporter NhaA [Alphaproteobacteria bacterium]|nr:Na+/H+ antiporter NhaA [Alphaproteobacteria bacterium]
MFKALREFPKLDSASGILLVGAALLALAVSNSPLAPFYDALLSLRLEIRIESLLISKPLLLWINDGLMAIFFLLVGLEVKRELLEGELSTPAQALLPAIVAAAGMGVPAAIYAALNRDDPVAIHGWAIPTATDIAFALGILALVGSRVPVSLKVFLTAVAIFDDLGAIIIIAAFYTANLSLESLVAAAIATSVLFGLNIAGVTRRAPYFLIGIVLWVCVLKSGVHATLSGVVLALAIPLRAKDRDGRSPLHEVEETLQPWVGFGIMPLFAFANAGIPLAGLSLTTLLEPVPLGIAAGLFIGKQLGVFGTTWLVVRSGWAPALSGATWSQVYGVALLAGVGFTMSLFIGTLAFDSAQYSIATRLGVLSGSFLSAAIGYAVLRLGTRAAPAPAETLAR